jgi:hypothetical protein
LLGSDFCLFPVNDYNSASAIVHNYLFNVPQELVARGPREIGIDFTATCFDGLNTGVTIDETRTADRIRNELERRWRNAEFVAYIREREDFYGSPTGFR